MVNGSPSRGAPPLGGEGWAQEHGHPLSHPSVTFGDSSPRRGATHTRYFGCCRGEHCSPAESYAAAKLPGRTLFAPTTYPKSAIKNRNFASSHRRVLAPGRGQCVRSWILKGALAKRSCAARTQAPLSRASRAIGSSGTLFGSFWGSKRNTQRVVAHYNKGAAAGWRPPGICNRNPKSNNDCNPPANMIYFPYKNQKVYQNL